MGEFIQAIDIEVKKSIFLFIAGVLFFIFYGTRRRSRSEKKRFSNMIETLIAIAFMFVCIQTALFKNPYPNNSEKLILNDWVGITVAIIEIIISLWAIIFVVKRKFK